MSVLFLWAVFALYALLSFRESSVNGEFICVRREVSLPNASLLHRPDSILTKALMVLGISALTEVGIDTHFSFI